MGSNVEPKAGMRFLPRLLTVARSHRRIPALSYRNQLKHQQPQLLSYQSQKWFSSEVESTESELEDPDFGDYEIILPPKQTLSLGNAFTNMVPPRVLRPPYITDPSTKSLFTSSRLELGSEDEKAMREASALAKQALDFAGGLVMVRSTLEYWIDTHSSTRKV